MNNLIIGEGRLGINEIAREMKKSRSFVVLLQDWKSFGEYLGVDDVKLLSIERMHTLGIMQLGRIPGEILKIWKADKGRNATLKILHEALEDCGVHDIAEMLLAKFLTTESVKMLQFMWHGKKFSLGELLGKNTSEETYQKILQNVKSCYPSNPLQLIKEELKPPELPTYYIQRTLIYFPSVGLNPRIFSSESSKDHVFLFKGIDKPTLARCMNYEQIIELSGDQLTNVTARFIILECDEDFHRIRKNTDKPVHVIQYEGDRQSHSWAWIRSNQGLDLIRQFLKDEKTPIDEQKFLGTIMAILSPPFEFSIADSPGMGKTFVLANLARQIESNCVGNAIVFFINIQELVQQINHGLVVKSRTSAIEAIASYSTSSEIPKLVLTEMLRNDSQQVYLFLDGYDEVMQDKLDFVGSILNHLQEMKNIIIVMTTRPHLTTRLENIFNQFSYQIRPFNTTNQINFLTKYWIEKHGAKEGNALKTFAELCLKTLQEKMTDDEKEIAGIPLQCMLLGEVYAEDAKRASTLETTLRENIVPPTSLFEMYEKLMEIKFARIREPRLRQMYHSAHIYEAMVLLLPEWVDIFQPLLHGRDEIDESTLYSVGLLERNPNSTKFLHRTFAEYLVAEFIVANLATEVECVNLLFGEILGRKGISKTKSEIPLYKDPYRLSHELKYQVIAYFIEMLLKKKRSQQNSIEDLIWPNYSKFTKFKSEDVCVTVVASCSHDLENIFDYSTKMLHQFRIGVDIQDEYFRTSPHVVIRSSRNVQMLEKMITFTRLEFNVTIRYHTMENYLFSPAITIRIFTPLYVAVMMGNYNAVAYLVKQYQDEIMNLEKLLHVCVYESENEKKSIIDEKLLIIDKLISLNRNWLEETDMSRRTVFLQPKVHLCLLQRLVERGAKINEYSSYYGTVLHTTRDKDTYLDRVRWALSNGFNLVNKGDYTRQTPLMHAIRLRCSREDGIELLKLFHQAGADFNAVDEDGKSVLLKALEYSKCFELVQKMLEYGSKAYHTTGLKRNALHVLLNGATSIDDRLLIIDLLLKINRDLLEDRDGWDCTPLLKKNVPFSVLQRLVVHGADINAYSMYKGTVLHRVWNMDTYTDLVNWVFSRGFKLINHKNKEKTPLMHAIYKFGSEIDLKVLRLFHEAGGDFNAQDADKNSILFYALRHSSLRYDFIMKLIEYGASVNHVNVKNENPLHVLVSDRSKSIKDALLIMDMLVEFNRDLLEKKDANGYTPLFSKQAAHTLLQRLVEDGANINALSNDGKTLLHVSECQLDLLQWASTSGFKLINQKVGSDGTTLLMDFIKGGGYVDDNVLKLFLDAGADLNALDADGNSVLFYALDHINVQPDFVRKLLEYNVNMYHVNNAKQNALMKVVNGPVYAKQKRKEEVVVMLVQISPGFLEDRDELGCTALLQRYCTLKMMQQLVKHGADINAYSSHYGTILHFNDEVILEETYPKLVSCAFSNGFRLVNQTDRFNRTPLMHAIETFGSVDDDVLKLFHDAGADLNALDQDGNSVLFYALDHKNVRPDFVRKLLQYNVDVNHVNKVKENALMRLKDDDNDKDEDEEDEDGVGYFEECENRKVEIFEILVQMSPGLLEGRDEFDCTALLQRDCTLSMMQLLVKHGADINAYSSHYGTILHFNPYEFDKETYPDLVNWAFSKGFRLINHTDCFKRTQLMYAIEMFGSVDDEVLKLFHDAGADFNAEDPDGNSVLFYALDHKNVRPDFVRKLLQYNVDVNHVNKVKENALMRLIDEDKDDDEDGVGYSEKCENRKVEILEILIQISPGLLEGRDELKRTALLQRNCTLSMMQLLVKRGADINAYSSHYGTILHSNPEKIDRQTYTDLVSWAFSNGFTLINHTDRFQRTPLMHAIVRFEGVGDEVLRHFEIAGQNRSILKFHPLVGAT